jgi:hypothetical protein
VIGPPAPEAVQHIAFTRIQDEKVPGQSPVKTRSAEVVVTDASIGRLEWYFHLIAPVDAFTAVSQPPDLDFQINKHG